jgi:large subunit ribosomal protein L30e
MSLTKQITLALKEGRVLFGIRSAKRAITSGKVETIVVASNCPVTLVSELENLSKISGFSLSSFDGSNTELGTLCRKPFPVSVLVVIKK